MKMKKKLSGQKIAQMVIVCVGLGLLGLNYYLRAKYWYKGTDSGIVRKENAHIDGFDSGGMTGLMKAADAADYDKVLWYLQQGANPNLQSRDIQPDYAYRVPRKYTPLHYAALRGSFNKAPEVMKLLLENGADPHLRDFNGNPPLNLIFFAVDWLYQEPMTVTLLQYGADPNAQSSKGNTFVHEALENSNEGIIKLVRDKFNSLVNLNIKNNMGLTPYEYAQKGPKKGQLGILDSADEELNRLFVTPGVIIGADGNVNARDWMGNTALMCAIMRGDEAMAKSLIAKGAPLKATAGQLDSTALHVAIMQQKPAMIKLVLEKSTASDVTKKNNRGNTPLHVAMNIADASTRTMTVDALLKRGTELNTQDQLNVQNKNGETSFHAAIATGDAMLVRHLLTDYRKQIDLTLRNSEYRNAYEIANLLRYSEIAALIQASSR